MSNSYYDNDDYYMDHLEVPPQRKEIETVLVAANGYTAFRDWCFLLIAVDKDASQIIDRDYFIFENIHYKLVMGHEALRTYDRGTLILIVGDYTFTRVIFKLIQNEGYYNISVEYQANPEKEEKYSQQREAYAYFQIDDDKKIYFNLRRS